MILTTSKSSVIHFFLTVAVVVVTLSVLVIIAVFFFWGDNQALTSEQVEQRLVLGVTPAEAERSLGLMPGALTDNLMGTQDRQSVSLSERGAIGSFFVPQHRITLHFVDNRLTGCTVKYSWQVDEHFYDCQLNSK